MPLVVHTLPTLSDEDALASKETLPHFLRFKSQSLCNYLSVSQDGEGKLTFSAELNHCDTSIVFETVHVHTIENLRPYGRRGVKIKSLATKKFWKYVDNSKGVKYKPSQHEGQGVGSGKFRVIMAISDSEEDADIFDIEVKEIGKESKKVILRNPSDRRYLGPFKLCQSTALLDTANFLGCMSKEISWKESILIVECVIGPRTIWPMGITSESALATFILSNHVEPSEGQKNEDPYPPTIILPPSFPLSNIWKRSLDNILMRDTQPLETPVDTTISIDGSAKNKSHSNTKLGGSTEEPVQASIKKQGLIKDPIVPQMPSKSTKDGSNKKKLPKGMDAVDETGHTGDTIELPSSPTLSLADAPRKLKPEEMAVLYCDSADPCREQDPYMVDISHFESQFIHYMNVDWAKDWKYSLTGENDDQQQDASSNPLSQSERQIHRSRQLWETMKLLKTWPERQTLIDNYTGAAAKSEANGKTSQGLQEEINETI